VRLVIRAGVAVAIDSHSIPNAADSKQFVLVASAVKEEMNLRAVIFTSLNRRLHRSVEFEVILSVDVPLQPRLVDSADSAAFSQPFAGMLKC
jgi:hypothetical protein